MFTSAAFNTIKDVLLIVFASLTVLLTINVIVNRKKTKKIDSDYELLIEEAKTMSNEAVKEARAKTEFVANMSHEIRTPLNAISCAAELLFKEELPPTAKSYLNILKSSADSLLDITNDILDFSKMDAGKLSLIENEYKLKTVIDDVKNIVSNKIDDSHVIFTIDIDPEIPSILIGDEVRIKQVLINLLNNAFKYTVKGVVNLKIEFERLSADSIDLTISVSDTGCGIAPTEREKLKKRIEDSACIGPKFSEGKGLGLPISSQIAYLMGGKISFESDLGVGSTFKVTVRQRVRDGAGSLSGVEFGKTYPYDFIVWEENFRYRDSLYSILESLGIPAKFISSTLELDGILSSVKVDYVVTTENHFQEIVTSINRHSPTTIPVKLVDVGEAADTSFDGNFAVIRKPFDIFGVLDVCDSRERISRHNAEHGGKLMTPDARLLLVDDNRVNLKVARALLETFDAKVVSVDSGFEAVELVKLGEKFDLIFMDHMMPGMDGIEAAKRIWDFEGEKRTPVIALTANAGGEVEKLFFEAGMSDFIPKPIVIKHLNYVLQKWLPKEKQIFSEGAAKKEKNNFGRMRSKAFQPEWGLSRIWNDEKIFLGLLHVYMDKSEELYKVISDGKDLKARVEAAKELTNLAISAGAARLPDILSEMVTVGELNAESAFNLKAEYLMEERKLLNADITEYIEQNEVIEDLTFE